MTLVIRDAARSDIEDVVALYEASGVDAHSGAPAALVEDVAVHPGAQGRGIGRALMQHAMAIAREAGCYKLALSCNHKREAAHAFYDRLGLRRHGVSFVVDLEE